MRLFLELLEREEVVSHHGNFYHVHSQVQDPSSSNSMPCPPLVSIDAHPSVDEPNVIHDTLTSSRLPRLLVRPITDGVVSHHGNSLHSQVQDPSSANSTPSPPLISIDAHPSADAPNVIHDTLTSSRLPRLLVRPITDGVATVGSNGDESPHQPVDQKNLLDDQVCSFT